MIVTDFAVDDIVKVAFSFGIPEALVEGLLERFAAVGRMISVCVCLADLLREPLLQQAVARCTTGH